ncbi:MAG TPA: nucleotide exchange factor GrpE [Candidatus Hydrogenedentes bacterium]|nr:nucleotide exchange factor GrpE [Candidatus Hydrogenedentota bacterium]HOV72983.1 nucleotide exchange factor GrpE [Candidatus Hydrogenedentota bacterium]HPC15829.1 nucleotide exchange factor GrpE [Candidatus Hydrogenedentota bacterium]HRT19762.1 nucleotide exchange factor GrpE [Candidatus Hydrogenedentota bacterium]HRT64536.1 nucleotide exchange factor GrpE [Candidatus Hydrogenedentota bacterium]
MKKDALKKTELEKKLEAEAAQEKTGTQPEPPPPPEVDVAALLAERDALRAECDAQKDQFLRTRADFDNYRKRMLREMDQIRIMAAERLVQDLLPVLDNLERAVEHAQAEPAGLIEGVEMVAKQFRDALGRHGVEPIAAAGQPFDPACHEAVACLETADCPPDHVAREMLKGYRMGGSVIRPAKVVVGKAPAEEPPAETNESETSTE